MQNHLFSNIGSLCLLGGYMFLASTTVGPWCFTQPWPASRCEKINPVTSQYHITVHVADRLTGEPAKGVHIRLQVNYLDAVVDLEKNSCEQDIYERQEMFQYSNDAGIVVFTTNAFQMDNKGDQVLIQADVVDTRYSTNQVSAGRYYDGASDVVLDLSALSKDAL